VVSDVAGFPLQAYPALQVEDGEVCLRLFRHVEDAHQAQAMGVPRLAERVLQRELAWMQKDLRSIGKWKDLYITLGPAEELETSAFENLKRHLLARSTSLPRTAAGFKAMVALAREQMPGLVPTLVSATGEILQLRQSLLLGSKPYPGLLADLNQLLPRKFLSYLAFDRLPQLPRYLKAMRVRAERAALGPAKDAEKLKRVQPFLDARQALLKNRTVLETARARLETFFWLVEEFKVSIFAQELGTAEPVSPRKLELLLAELMPQPDGKTR
jgi:ATP-dependent helicase HrpA